MKNELNLAQTYVGRKIVKDVDGRNINDTIIGVRVVNRYRASHGDYFTIECETIRYRFLQPTATHKNESYYIPPVLFERNNDTNEEKWAQIQ